MDDHVITNGTNTSTSMMGIKLWAFAIFSSFLLYSFIANIILLIVLYKNESISFNRTFTYVSLQLIICSFISYIPQLAIVLPETLYEDLFNVLTFSEMPFSKQEFSGTRLQWIKKHDGSRMGSQLRLFKQCFVFGLPIITFMMHIAIFNNLRQKRNNVLPYESGKNHNISCITEIFKCRFIKLTDENNERNKHEILILIQGAIFCALVELEILSFKFLRTILVTSDDKANIRMNIFVNCTIICLSAIQPTVFFICNKRIRRYVIFELMSKLKMQKG